MTWNSFDNIPKTEGYYLVCVAGQPEPVSWHSEVVFFDMKHGPVWHIEDATFEAEPTHWAEIPEVT